MEDISETNRESVDPQIVQLLKTQLNRADTLLGDVSIPREAYVAWVTGTLAILAQWLGEQHESVRQFRTVSAFGDIFQLDDNQIGMCLNDQMSILDRIIRQIRSNPSLGMFAFSASERSSVTEFRDNEIQYENGNALSAEKQVRIFLSYARADRDPIELLYQKLIKARYKPWMDEKDILPGEDFALIIERAIRNSDFFFACLSENSCDKRGWVQREINRALDIWQEKLPDDIYLIPIKLDNCKLPERLERFQSVNLFERDGWDRLIRSLEAGVHRQRH